MNIGCEEKIHIARYLNFLLSAEKVAHRCSAMQAKICDSNQARDFFITQSRQEKFHAVTFRAALLWLAPKGVTQPAKKHVQKYESLLLDATDRHDLLSSVIGLQVILEGMGEIALTHFNHGIEQRGTGYRKIRQAILNQEDSHHEYGLSFLKGKTLPAATASHAANCLTVINEMMASLSGQFDFFEEDAGLYLLQFNHGLPEQLQSHALDYHTGT